MPAERTVEIAVAPPLSEEALAVSLRYFDDLVSRYHGRPARPEELADVAAGYPSELLQEPHGLLLLARRGGEVVGCAGMRFVTEPGSADSGSEAGADAGSDAAAEASSARIGEVTRVFVDGAARGLGLGRLLMTELEAQARRRGLSALRLDTRSDLVEARRLYAAVGFVEGAAHNDDPYAEHWFRKQLGG